MNLEKMYCTSCGATFVQDSSQEYGVCEYCGSVYSIQDAIHNYIKITELRKEKLIKNADAFYQVQEYQRALNAYRDVANDYPEDYRGWYGQAYVKSRAFTDITADAHSFQQVEGYFKKALVFAPEKERTTMQQKWNDYIAERNVFLRKTYDNVQSIVAKRDAIMAQRLSVEKEISSLEREAGRLYQKVYAPHQKTSKKWVWLLILVWPVLVIYLITKGIAYVVSKVVLSLRRKKLNKIDFNLFEKKNHRNFLYEEERKANASIDSLMSRYDFGRAIAEE